MRPRSSLQRDAQSRSILLLLVLSWLAMASSFSLPVQLTEMTDYRLPKGPCQQIQPSAPTHRRLSSSYSSRILADNASSWNTLDGSPPLVIAHGGSSGLFPDQTNAAYFFAAAFSLPNSAMFCDLQLTKDGYGICRTGIDLSQSTTINNTLPNLSTKYTVNGMPTTGFFSVDLTIRQALNNISATQANPSRSPFYDGDPRFFILEPVDVVGIVSQVSNTSLYWMNVEYPSFFAEHKLDMSSYVLSLMKELPVDFVSSPEIAFLKAVKTGATKNSPKLILKFRDADQVEPSTNVTYGTILRDLKSIATYATGILVPKEFIWPVDNKTLYLGVESNLVKAAHTAGLAVYGAGFVSDPPTPIYNYSFDPIQEYLQFVPTAGSALDGFLTDFPTTASGALGCFRGIKPQLGSTGTKPFIISHNGDSGNYPGCTILAYKNAVTGGATHIDCPVQMTKDGVPFCRESVNLLSNTDVSTHSNFMARAIVIPKFQAEKGLFSINMTWAEIQTLKAIMYSPEEEYKLMRNPSYTQESIITLSDFLSFAKNTSVGILIDLQNAYFLETEIGLDVVGAVLRNLNTSGLGMSDRVVIQSEDSAILQRFQQLANYTSVFKVVDVDVLVTKTEVSAVKALANIVTLPRGLVQLTYKEGYLRNATDLVDLFHAQNVSVFVSYLRNEFVTIPFDYEADPTMEINTLIQYYGVDGLITDFPATASNYLSNSCLNLKTQSTGLQYSLRTVVPGSLVTVLPPNIAAPSAAPTTLLNVTDGEVALPPTFSPRPSPVSPQPESPAASSPTKSDANEWLKPNILLLFISVATIFVCYSWW